MSAPYNVVKDLRKAAQSMIVSSDPAPAGNGWSCQYAGSINKTDNRPEHETAQMVRCNLFRDGWLKFMPARSVSFTFFGDGRKTEVTEVER